MLDPYPSGKKVFNGPYRDLYLAEMRWRIEAGTGSHLKAYFETLDGGDHTILMGAAECDEGFELFTQIAGCTDEAEATKLADMLRADLAYWITASTGVAFDYRNNATAQTIYAEDTGWCAICRLGDFPTRDDAFVYVPVMQSYGLTLSGFFPTPSPPTKHA